MSRAARLLSAVRRASRFEIHAWWRSRPIRRGVVFYESFAGNGALCNPEALFRELLSAPDMASLTHIWALDAESPHTSIRREFARDPRVTFVRYRSSAYFRALATSEYLINNATFPPEFSKRTGQVYVNTWHGTPLKLMGYDMPSGATESANVLRNFVAADYLLSQNDFMTTRMYAGSYRLDKFFRGAVIEEGYPRVDLQFLSPAGNQETRSSLAAAGIDVGDRGIILYAPTWKGTSFAEAVDDIDALISDVNHLQSNVDPDRWIVLLKTHQVVHRYAGKRPALRRVLVPNDIPTNRILGVTTALVTDYSSIFFDFLASNRPIIFYTPDQSDYSAVRGTYFPPEEWPGPVCTTVEEVASAVAGSLPFAPRGVARVDVVPVDEPRGDAPPTMFDRWREQFVASDRGGSARRVVDVVFRHLSDGYRVRSLGRETRPTVLVYLGGLRSNGITSSALNLLNAIAHSDVCDVSVCYALPMGPQTKSNQARISPSIRQFPRIGGMNGSKVLQIWRRVALVRAGRPGPHSIAPILQNLYHDEWIRCYGDSQFDYVVDFSGYSPFWALTLLHSSPARRSIWLHNDMAAEVHRRVSGRKRMKHTLPAIFSLYPQFDSLVSVSPTLRDINRRNLTGRGIDPGSFSAARNLLDARGVLNGRGAQILAFDEFVPSIENPAAEIPAWARELARGDHSTVWFVTVGRFSPEKNQARLIRAFARVHASHAQTRLLLIGYGALEQQLRSLVERLDLTDVAFLAGPFKNPYPLMAAAQCFVLSSDYEGQPMVLLEAALLGLPIVSVDFESVHDALPGDAIHVVKRDEEALAAGLEDFLGGRVKPSSIDTGAYNTDALTEFFAGIGLPAGVPGGEVRTTIDDSALGHGTTA
jgi:CDP-glycerol glycerophosphotransferase (TagB/SpsB family)/glycosyltransferase involved in cell wall biosynthesis